jgi:hypothetical protein
MQWSIAVIAASLALALAAPARADDGPRADAKTLALQGDAEFYAGHCDRAIPLWQRAEAAYHAPTILLRIARCQAMLGHVITAVETLEAVTREPIKADTPPAFAGAVELARRDLVAVRARVATLHVVVHSAGDRVPVVIEIDGAAQPAGATSFPVDPGEHAVRVRAGGSSWQSTVRLRDGQLLSCDVALWAEAEPKPPQVQRGLGLAALGAGGAAVFVGVGFSVAALDTSRRLDAICGQGRDHCPPSAQNDIDHVRTFSSVADGAIGSGAALVIAGAIALVTAPRPAGDAWRVRFAATPFGLRGEF